MASNPVSTKKLKVTLIKSIHGQLQAIVSSVRGLGLRRPHHSVVVPATAENLGMINAATHLLKVEEAQS